MSGSTLTASRRPNEITSLSASTVRIKPAICWPGGKSRYLDQILPLIPEHTCYCEPFAGGLAVLLGKPRSNLEVINDADGELVNFYRCVRFHRDALLDELEFVLNSREEFNAFRQQVGLTDLQRAARWFHRNKICFGGSRMDSFGTGALSGGASHGSRANRMDSIRALNQRLDRACIEHLDWQRCLEKYDRPSTFFFCDPPYTECDAGMYAAWTDADVRRFRDCLLSIRGRWLVTLNDTPAIRDVFDGCQFYPFSRARGINNTAGGPTVQYHELIIAPVR